MAGHPNAQAGAPAAADVWPEAEIKEAKAYCQNILRGIDGVFVEEDPIKQGACGSPVVFKVSRIGKGNGVELSPPVTLTCDMIVSLDKWVKTDVQPKARALLGAWVVRIDTMSSYSCRNAYGRTRTKLSEHGRANAIDIAGFTTAKDTALVLTDWGLTAREQKALAAKQEAERAAQAAAAANSRSTGGIVATGVPGTIAPMPGTARIAPMPGSGASSVNSLGLAPNRLGGPKPESPAAAREVASSGKRAFLREIHGSACKHFGTVLGPEANNAHKNHFHLDMAPRKVKNICE